MRRLFVLLQNIISIPKRIFCTHVSVFAILQNSTYEKGAAICKGVKFYRSRIGRYSYIGGNTFVNNTSIGSFTSISSNCYIGGTSHPISWVSTSPVFHRWGNIMHTNFGHIDYDIFADSYIGNDVWIGERCLVKSGVRIGDGAVVGMGSVVTKDIPPYQIWAGNPAHFIRNRFDEETIQQIEQLEWWKWDEEKLKKYGEYFNSPENLFEKVCL